jgi:hypothetical protein
MSAKYRWSSTKCSPESERRSSDELHAAHETLTSIERESTSETNIISRGHAESRARRLLEPGFLVRRVVVCDDVVEGHVAAVLKMKSEKVDEEEDLRKISNRAIAVAAKRQLVGGLGSEMYLEGVQKMKRVIASLTCCEQYPMWCRTFASLR